MQPTVVHMCNYPFCPLCRIEWLHYRAKWKQGTGGKTLTKSSRNPDPFTTLTTVTPTARFARYVAPPALWAWLRHWYRTLKIMTQAILVTHLNGSVLLVWALRVFLGVFLGTFPPSRFVLGLRYPSLPGQYGAT